VNECLPAPGFVHTQVDEVRRAPLDRDPQSKVVNRMTSHRKIPCRATAALGSNKNPDVFLFLAIFPDPQSLVDDE
jgi:hypothetical protein